MFVAPLRGNAQRRNTLIRLGIVYAIATLAIIALSDWADGGRFEALQAAMADSKVSAKRSTQMLLDPQLHFGLLRALRAGRRAVGAVLVRAGARRTGTAKASARRSSRARWPCGGARGAFLMYLLAWTVVIALFGLLVQLVFSMLGTPQMAGVAALPGALMFSTVFYASLYFSFDDSFELSQASRESC